MSETFKPSPEQAGAETGSELSDAEKLSEIQERLTRRHKGSKERIEDESRPEAAELELFGDTGISRRKKTEILQLLLDRGTMQAQVIREGAVYCIDKIPGTDEFDNVLLLDDMGVPDMAWQIDEETIRGIKKIIAD